MGTHRLQTTMLAGIALLALGIGACTRSASTPPPSPGAGEETPGALTSQQATMEAVRFTLLTQTAQAMAEEGTPSGPSQATPTPTATPAVTQTAVVVTTEPTTPEGPTEYTVLPGDWVYSIARKFDVDPQAIIELNNLQPPYVIQPGDTLMIPAVSGEPSEPSGTPLPGGTVYTVQPGEWVYSIARKFGVDPQAIIDANNLQFPYTLYPGDELIIP